MATLGKLVVSLAANTSGLVTELAKSRKGFASWSKVGAKSVAIVTSAFLTLKAVLLTGIIVAVNKNAEAINKIAKTASKLGESVGGIQKLNYMFELTGVSIETGNMALQRMVRRVAEAAQGFGEAKGALKELGIDAVQLSKLSPAEQFYQVSEAMQSISNQGDKVRLAMKLFDSEGVALVNTMNANLQDLGVEFDSLGIVITDQQARMVEAYQDAKTKLGAIFGGFGLVLTTELAGPFRYVIEYVTETIKNMGGMRSAAQSTAKFMVRAIGGVVKVIGFMVKGFLKTELAIAKSENALMRYSNTMRKLSPVLRLLTDGFSAEDIAASALNISKVQSELESGVPKVERAVQDFLDGLTNSIGTSANLNDVVTNMIADGLSGIEKQAFLDAKLAENDAVKKASSGAIDLAQASAKAAKTLDEVAKSKAWKDIFGAEDITARSAEFDKYAKLAKANIESGSGYSQSNINTLKSILETAKNNGGVGFSNNNLFEKLDLTGMAEVIKGLEAIVAGKGGENAAQASNDSIDKLVQANSVSQNIVDKLIQSQQGQKTLGKLEIDMTTDTGKVAGEIFGEPEFLSQLKDFVTKQTNNAARQAVS